MNDDIQYIGVQQIAKKFRKPDMKLLSNITALSPRNRKTSLSPRSQNSSPRTKLQNLLNKDMKQKVEQKQNEMENQMRMSVTKLNFNKKEELQENGNSPRLNQQEKSTNSFFRRIFCLSPKVLSARKNTIQEENDKHQLIAELSKSQIVIDDTKQQQKSPGSPISPRIIERRKSNQKKQSQQTLTEDNSNQQNTNQVNNNQQQFVETLSIPSDTLQLLQQEQNNDKQIEAQHKDQLLSKTKSTSQLQLKITPTQLIQSPTNSPGLKSNRSDMSMRKSRDIKQKLANKHNNSNKKKIEQSGDKSDNNSKIRKSIRSIGNKSQEFIENNKNEVQQQESPSKAIWDKLESLVKSKDSINANNNTIQKEQKIKKIKVNNQIQTNLNTSVLQKDVIKSPLSSFKSKSFILQKSPKSNNKINYSEQSLNESLNLHMSLNQKMKEKTSFLNKNKQSNNTLIKLNLKENNHNYIDLQNQTIDFDKTERQNQSFSINNSITSRNLFTKIKPALKSKSILETKHFNKRNSVLDEKMSISSPSRNYQTKDNSRKSSQSVMPSEKQSRLKIQRILDEQKAQKNLSLIKLVNNMETKLFHKSPTNKQTRSKSVLKTLTALPYTNNIKQLPDISHRLNLSNISNSVYGGNTMDGRNVDISDFQTETNSLYYNKNNKHKSGGGGCGLSELDDVQLQSALDRYITEPLKDSVLSHNSSKNAINLTYEAGMSLTSSKELLPLGLNDPDFKSQLKELQENNNNTSQVNMQNEEPKVMISVVNLMMKHQIFKKMQQQSVKNIITKCCSLMFFKKGQILYKEEDETKDFYLLIYGGLNIWSKKNGNLGRIVPGFTAGEESLLDKNYICRLDNCFAEQESCVFQIDKDEWINYKHSIDSKEVVLLKDIAQLEGILNRNYIIKKGWKQGGISKLIQGKKSYQVPSTNFFNLQNNKIE